MKWKFSQQDQTAADRCYREQGFVGFDDLLTADDVAALQQAFDDAVASGDLTLGEDAIAPTNDAIFRHPLFEQFACDERIVSTVERLLGTECELQHSKLNCKPLNDQGGGEVEWHQDFPFFPHSNYDLAALVIHLDTEEETSGPLRVIPGSHQWGALSHCREENFAYQCTAEIDFAAQPQVALIGSAGLVTAHHCLTLHTSAHKTNDRHRRLLVLQYRATDAVQLAGVIWQCTGYEVRSVHGARGRARFPDGTTIEIRGAGGRLYDKFGKMAPTT